MTWVSREYVQLLLISRRLMPLMEVCRHQHSEELKFALMVAVHRLLLPIATRWCSSGKWGIKPSSVRLIPVPLFRRLIYHLHRRWCVQSTYQIHSMQTNITGMRRWIERSSRDVSVAQVSAVFVDVFSAWLQLVSSTNMVLVLGVLVPVGNQSKVLFAANSWNSTTGQPLCSQTWWMMQQVKI